MILVRFVKRDIHFRLQDPNTKRGKEVLKQNAILGPLYISMFDLATVTNLFQSVNVWLEEVSQTLSKCWQSVCECASLVSGNVRQAFSENVGQTSHKIVVKLIDNQVMCSWNRWQTV